MFEGRPFCGFAEQVSKGDWINFYVPKANNGQRLMCQVLDVHRYDSFASMLKAHDVTSFLPGVTSTERGVSLYRSFRNKDGDSYGDLEVAYGVVAFRVKVLIDQQVAKARCMSKSPA